MEWKSASFLQFKFYFFHHWHISHKPKGPSIQKNMCVSQRNHNHHHFEIVYLLSKKGYSIFKVQQLNENVSIFNTVQKIGFLTKPWWICMFNSGIEIESFLIVNIGWTEETRPYKLIYQYIITSDSDTSYFNRADTDLLNTDPPKNEKLKCQSGKLINNAYNDRIP